MSLPSYPDAKHANEFERGLRFQDFVIEALAKHLGIVIQIFSSQRYQFNNGESVQGWEIKLDKRCTGTGRLSVETAEKSRADIPFWTPSGIFRKDNTLFYVQGNKEVFWVFFKHHLVNHFNEQRPYEVEKFGTVRTFYMNNTKADELGLRIDLDVLNGKKGEQMELL